jgi:dTDP-glucose 4,6-dehydratase
MRLLVTGGAGFIGSNFVQYLLAVYPDYEVVVLDKLTYASNSHKFFPIAEREQCTFLQGDICDAEAVTRAMEGCDAVVNFAAETHVDRSIREPGTFFHTNIPGTYTLLEVARTCGVKRFVQISTDEVYGDARSPEGLSRPSVETDPPVPLSPYAASKAAAEQLVLSYRATYGLPIVITRCSNNYGPYQYPEKQLPLFILNALDNRPLPVYGDGKNSRNWIYVRDHITAIDQLLHADAAAVVGEVFNIGSAEERTTLQNALTVLDILGKPHDLIRFVPDRKGHVLRHAVDTTKIRRALGWEPQVAFSNGIIQTITWYRENSVWVESVKARGDEFLHNAMHLGT